ncbi:MAG: hypothetical protein QME07_06415 [bacterium]|nr:hypothetical protein [bacterium]
MPTIIDIRKRLEMVFNEKQAIVLSDVITSSYNELVKTSDFSELKEIVKELAEAQKRTEIEVQKTQIAVQKTEIEIQKLTKGLKETNQNFGGLSRSMGYALENEVYRALPTLLKNSYGIELKERLIRTEIGGKEINILGRAKRNGSDVLVVGEVKIRLDNKRKKDVFNELEEKVQAVKVKYKEEPIRVLITHYATKGFMDKAKNEGVIVIQSFEW